MIDWTKERVFVSGGSGVIGRILVQELLQKGATVFSGDLCPKHSWWKGKLIDYHGDLNEITQETLQGFSPTYYFHLAATFERSEESYGFWEENFHHNVNLSHYLITLLKDISSLKKVVFASSYLIYDPKSYLFETPQRTSGQLLESSPIHPRNLCGASKLFHEKELTFLEAFCQNRWSFVSARIFRSFGRGSKDVISRWIRALLRKEPIIQYLPEGRFDYIYADDVAEGLIKLAETSQAKGIYNLGSGNSCAVYEVIQTLKNHFPAMNVSTANQKGLYEASQADMSRFKEICSWQPHTIEEAISKIIHYEKAKLNP